MIIADEISQYHWFGSLVDQQVNTAELYLDIQGFCVARIVVLAVWFLREIMSGK